jgi:hypothetical protein
MTHQMTIKLSIAIAGALAGTMLAVPASAAGTYGSSSSSISRTCGAANAACLGPQVRQTTGGLSTGSAINTAYSGASYAAGSVAFEGLDLPTIRSAVNADGDFRLSTVITGFQTYTYAGAAPIELSFAGNLHIVGSSLSPNGGSLAGGSTYIATLAIVDQSLVAGLLSADSIRLALSGIGACGSAGILGHQQISGTLTGGEQNFGLSTVSCSGSPIMISPGQSLVTIATLGLTANRGGFVDASQTFSLGLDPRLPEQVRTELTQNLESAAVPEPATWALMLGGFGLAGWTLRRRRNLGRAHHA